MYWPILVGRAAYFGAVQGFFISVSIYFVDASGVNIHQPGAFAHDVGWNDLEAWSNRRIEESTTVALGPSQNLHVACIGFHTQRSTNSS